MNQRSFDRFTRTLARHRTRRSTLKMGIGGFALAGGLGIIAQVASQEATPTTPTVEWLFTLSFREAILEPDDATPGQATVTLTEVDSNVLAFSDRPVRRSELISIDDLAGLVDHTPNDPANANLVARLPESTDTAEYIVELLAAHVDSATGSVELEVTVTSAEIANQQVEIDGLQTQQLRSGYLFIDPECATQDDQGLLTCYG